MSEFLRRALRVLKRATMRDLRAIEKDQRSQVGRRRKIKRPKRPCRSRPSKAATRRGKEGMAPVQPDEQSPNAMADPGEEP